MKSNTMDKTCNVVMLATNEKAVRLGQLVIGAGNDLFSSRQSNDIGSLTAYELYITSDEEINNDDWCVLDLGENTRIVQVESLNSSHPIFTVDIIDGYAHLSNLRKIIATTDKSITIDGYDSSDEESIVKCYFPHLSKEFIEAYIKAYNKGNVITKVMVEYEDSHTSQSKTPYLKINPDYTINIKPIKDSWTKDEVTSLLFKQHSECAKLSWSELDQWVKENL